MSWNVDLLELAKWSLQKEDLRYRMLYAKTPAELPSTCGIEYALETAVVLSIYEAAVGQGYKPGKTIGYERAYPSSEGNPKRTDLAFKDMGQGKNWGYVEVKYYGAQGKSHITKDIEKLRSISNRVQRWVLVYRVRPTEGRSKTLQELLERSFDRDLAFHGHRSFSTTTSKGAQGECEIVLARVT